MLPSLRIFLLFAISFVGFLLWEAWQRDTRPPVQPATALAPLPEEKNAPSFAEFSEVPSVSLEAGDLAPNPEVRLTTTQWIEVTTPLYKILINPEGGDIVSAKLLAYPQALNTPNNPFPLLSKDPESFFIAQSGLISDKGPDTPDGKRLVFTVPQNTFELRNALEELQVPLTLHLENGLTIQKIFTFKGNNYLTTVRYVVQNNSEESWHGKFYGQFKRKNINPNQSTRGSSTYFGAAISTPEHSYKKLAFKKLAESELNEEVKGGWLAFIQHYFIGAWIPYPDHEYRYYSKDLGEGYFRIGFTNATPLTVPAHEQKSVEAHIFLGPKDQTQLKAAAPKLELTVDYGWLWFLAQPLFWLLQWLYTLVGNWGWAIILVTIIVKAAFFQLSATSYKSMAKMRKIQPRLAALKERYGKDKQQFSQAIMTLYKEEKINPLGGCFPILIQIPVFIALYWVLLESVELRQAGFILWIHDLSSKDPYFVLPILMGITMLIQQLLSPAPPDPMQAKMMKILPIVFTFFFLFFPAGLVLYWLVSNLLSIAQQWLITRVILKEPKKVGA